MVHETPDGHRIQCATITVSVHILFEISVTVFKDKDEFGLGMDNVVKADNVDMFEFLHEGDLSDRGGGCSFFCIKMNLFESDDLVGGS